MRQGPGYLYDSHCGYSYSYGCSSYIWWLLGKRRRDYIDFLSGRCGMGYHRLGRLLDSGRIYRYYSRMEEVEMYGRRILLSIVNCSYIVYNLRFCSCIRSEFRRRQNGK